jgi:ADP-ribosylglycohydrolase
MAAASVTTTSTSIANRVKGAMYGLLIGDALAMPTHWYYGGAMEVRQTYGIIKSYVAPKSQKAGSIMPKSNTGGGGRGSYQGDVIGKLIFHDKKKYWKPGTSYHYHQGMAAGDNTLEGLLFRRVASILTTHGADKDALTSDYIDFMTTPGTHNDTYCGTCHRMFFANREAGKPLADCPDNDGHNVDSADALVAAVPAMLFSNSDNEAAENVETVISFTRNSPTAIQYAQTFATLLRNIVQRENDATDLSDAIHLLTEASTAIGFDVENAIISGRDPVTA